MDSTIANLLGPAESMDSVVPTFQIEIARDAQGQVVALADAIVVRTSEGETRTLTPRPLRQLFAGSAPAPELSAGPTPKLMPFFLLLEATVVRYCDAVGRDATDQEMERVYAELRRRPDATDGPLQSHLRAAARLYLSMREVSEAEYDAVMRRLAKSGRSFSEAPISRNYLTTLRQTFSG